MDKVPEISREAFGRAVAARRSELHLTQEALSLRSGLHQKWLSNVETARINPTLSNLLRLAGGLELPLSELIARAETIQSERHSSTGSDGPSQGKPARRKPHRKVLTGADGTTGSS